MAVVSISRARETPFTQEELTKIGEAVAPFGPALLMVAKASRSLPVHVIDAAQEGTSWLLAPGSWGRKVLAAAILAFVAYFCFATINYDVTVPCRIAPTEIRFFAAPFEGTIDAAHVEVGDEVVQGQMLYEMDTTGLELERAGLEREITVLKLKADQALAVDDVNSSALAGITGQTA